ncbi:MAG: hypothetical protein LAT63_16870 [Marinobacter sp.]|nr:hypothetical protein [Marinobacter sp.]
MTKTTSGRQQSMSGRHRLLAMAVSLCLAPTALAQTPPDIGDVLRQLPAEPPAQRTAPVLPDVTGIPMDPPMRQLPEGAPRLLVNGFDIEGNTVIGRNQLLALLADESGKRHSLVDLERLARQLSDYYRSQGYFLARAYVPAQEVVDGIIRFQIVEGRYGSFDLTNESLVRDDIIAGVLARAADHEVVSVQSLERALLIINDTPGAQVSRADVRPGQATGQSDFDIGTVPTARVNGYLVADNHGLKSTGEYRLTANLDVNSLFQRGNRLSFSGLTTDDGNLINGRMEYSTLLASNGLTGTLAFAQTEYELGDEFKSLEAEGEARSLEAGLSYPVIRSSGRNLTVGVTRAHRRLTDEIGLTDTRISKRSDTLALDTLFSEERVVMGYRGLFRLGASYTIGDLDIRDEQSLAADQAPGGPRTNGTFSRVNLNAAASLLLPWDLTATASVRGQKGLDRNLDGSERMGIAGSGGVMAYPSGEQSGRDALLGRLEFSRNMPAWGGLQHQAHLLSNMGRAQRSKDDSWRTLADAGVGWSMTHQDGLFLRTYAAARLTSEAQSEKTSRVNLLAQLGWVF